MNYIIYIFDKLHIKNKYFINLYLFLLRFRNKLEIKKINVLLDEITKRDGIIYYNIDEYYEK